MRQKLARHDGVKFIGSGIKSVIPEAIYLTVHSM